MEYGDTIPNYRYDFVSALKGALDKRGGGAMTTKWSLVMCSLAVLLVLSLGLLSSGTGSVSLEGKALTTEEVLALSDELEFAAIQAIHSQLDDNSDGKVDLSESEEFVQTELCGDSSVGEKQKVCFSSEKSQRFHQTDKQITSVELWMTWHANEVFNWTNDDVISWLKYHVHLPEYAEAFRRHKITGRLLPKVATNSGQVLQSVLLIADSQHRQKIQLRAMDAVLFGPPRTSGYWKDIIVMLSLLLCVLGVVYALRQRWIAQSNVDSFLEDFRAKEEELQKLRSKLALQEMDMPAQEETVRSSSLSEKEVEDGGEDEGLTRTSNTIQLLQRDSTGNDEDLLSEVSFSRSSSMQDPDSSLYHAQEENEMLRRRVQTLESELDFNRADKAVLQKLLQESCRREWEHLEVRKRMAEEQMAKAEKVCDKIKKRRSSVFGSLHLANSSALEEAGLQITKAVNNMQTISECFDEYHGRWHRVENVCGFQVCSSPNTPVHHQSHAHSSKYSQALASSVARGVAGTNYVDGVSLLRRGSIGELVPGYNIMHRSATLPQFRAKSRSVPLPVESDSSPAVPFYHPLSHSRSSSVSSSSTSSGSPAYPRSNYKTPGPLTMQQSLEGDADFADCVQFVGAQYVPAQIQHHQLHVSSVRSPTSSKRPPVGDAITELSEGQDTTASHGQVRSKPLKCSASVPQLLVRKDSYSEAIKSGDSRGWGGMADEQRGESSGGIMFTASSDKSPSATTSSASKGQSSTSENKQLLKLPSYWSASSSSGLEAIKEERFSPISLNSSGSSDASSSRSRAGSSSPDKTSKVKGRSQSPRATTTRSRNLKSISSDV